MKTNLTLIYTSQNQCHELIMNKSIFSSEELQKFVLSEIQLIPKYLMYHDYRRKQKNNELLLIICLLTTLSYKLTKIPD